MSTEKSSNTVKLMLRLPPGLHARVTDRAKGGGISLNKMIIRILENALTRNPVDQLENLEGRRSHLADSLIINEVKMLDLKEQLEAIDREIAALKAASVDSGVASD